MDPDLLAKLYRDELLSIPKISTMTGIAQSTIRNKLLQSNVTLRDKKTACKISCTNNNLKGKKRPPFSKEWKDNIKRARLTWSAEKSKGLSLKQNGYFIITIGKNKGKMLHILIMEHKIGRKLKSHECVHHIDENKTNNDPDNLELMTRSSHSKHHAIINCTKRKRQENGRFS